MRSVFFASIACCARKRFNSLSRTENPGVGGSDAIFLITAMNEAQLGNFCIHCNRPFDYAITTETPSGLFFAIKIVSFLTLDQNAIGC